MLCLAACSGSKDRGDVPEWRQSAAVGDSSGQCEPGVTPAADEHHFLIMPGDELTLDFYLSPEFNDDVIVRPDGKISLKLVGDEQAAGMTPADLGKKLAQAYSRELRDPQISVHIKNSPSRRVYVQGEVQHPGAFVLQPGETAEQAIVEAGGFAETAAPNSVVLIRRDACGRTLGSKLALSKVIDHPNSEEDALLAPSDILYVPKSTIANMDLFMKQYVQGLLPIAPSAYIPVPM